MKHLIILTTILVALFALTGCGESTRTTDTSSPMPDIVHETRNTLRTQGITSSATTTHSAPASSGAMSEYARELRAAANALRSGDHERAIRYIEATDVSARHAIKDMTSQQKQVCANAYNKLQGSTSFNEIANYFDRCANAID